MKKNLLNLSPKTRASLLTGLYLVIFSLMVYKIVTSKTVYEMILFSIPAAYCIFAAFGENTKSRYNQVNDFIYNRCEPQAALNYMAKYPSIQKTKKYSSPMNLLRAYALTDCGKYDDAEEYVNGEDVFTSDASKPIAAYLLFCIAFLRGEKRGVSQAFLRLISLKSYFTTDMLHESPSHIWYMCEGNSFITARKFAEAAESFKKIDLAQLKNNRELAYYNYSMSLISAGLGEREAADNYAEAARKLGPGLYAIKQL